MGPRRESNTMGLYLIGDVQGCDGRSARLLDEVAFSPSRDRLVLLGDLVNRGPDSAAVLRRLMALDGAATCLLGNHDLSLLAVAHGVRKPGAGDTMDSVLQAPDREALLGWLRRQSMALHAHGLLMVHAGVLPQWDVAQVLALAGEVEAGAARAGQPAASCRACTATSRRAGTTRSRAPIGCASSSTPDAAALLHARRRDAAEGRAARWTRRHPGSTAWFDVPGRKTAGTPIAFGHWSTLGYLLLRDDAIGLDTGCVWGGCLSALRYDPADGVARGGPGEVPAGAGAGGD
jgi:bis(5'-nucleosyl)-tetraphosphatase (symmetrical)